MKKKIIVLALCVLMISGCGSKIPKLSNGDEAIVTMKKDQKISVDELYEELKSDYALEALINIIDKKILEKKYADKVEEAKAETESILTQLESQYGDQLLEMIQQYTGYPSIEAYENAYYLSYLISAFIIAILQTVLFLILALIFKLPFDARLFLAMLYMLPSAIFYISFGILLGSICSNEKQAGPINSIIISTTGILGGIFMPISSFTGAFEVIVNLLPFSHSVLIASELYTVGASCIYPHIIYLLIYISIIWLVIYVTQKLKSK